jgi:hypothetical protein
MCISITRYVAKDSTVKIDVNDGASDIRVSLEVCAGVDSRL